MVKYSFRDLLDRIFNDIIMIYVVFILIRTKNFGHRDILFMAKLRTEQNNHLISKFQFQMAFIF